MKKTFRKLMATFLVMVMMMTMIPTVTLQVQAQSSIPDGLGLGHLLKGFNSLASNSADRILLVENLKNLPSERIFKENSFDVFQNFLFLNTVTVGDDKTIIARSMTEYALDTIKGWGFQANLELAVELGKAPVKTIVKTKIEERFSKITNELLRTSTNELYYESLTWLRRGIYEIDFSYIPEDLIRTQLNPVFLRDLLDKNVTPEQLFRTYGTHFLTQYSMGGWIEAGIYSIDETINEKISKVNEWSGTVADVNNSIEQNGTHSARHNSTTRIHGGHGGVINSTNPNDAQNAKNTWLQSFNRTDWWGVCEILTIPDPRVPLEFTGIWELLPEEEWIRYDELVQAYIALATDMDSNFFTNFIYRQLQPIGNLPPPSINENTIRITNQTELDAVRNNLSGTYILMNDITLSGNWEPIGSATAPFTGTFIGNGYTVSNVSIVSGNTTPGLFGINRGTIESLAVVYNNVNGHRPSSVASRTEGAGVVNASYPNWNINPTISR
ncbi:MAG: MAC/perforin domain-containing protein, partial [Oscillospiraceae bacterium]|nr:MAC/perforin domain-containing protein [Oscillospiraceae bacterium]